VLLTLLSEAGRGWETYRLTGYGIVIVVLMVALPGGLASLLAAGKRNPQIGELAEKGVVR